MGQKMNKDSLALKRFYVVAGLLFMVAVAVVVRLGQIQFAKGAEYRAMAAEKTTQNIPIKANRGNIYAQDGSLLATSVSRYDVRFDAMTVSASNFEKLMPQLAHALGEYFGRSASYYQNMLRKARSGNRRYQLIARDLNYTDFLAIKQMPLLREGITRVDGRYSFNPGMPWSISSAGFSESGTPTTLAGTPATVVWGGTSCSTTDPAPTLAPSPTIMLPRIFAPAEISTPSPIFGCRSPSCLPVPPRVTD